MILTTSDLIALALNELSEEHRNLVEAHILDDQSIYTLVRRHCVRKRDIESTLAAAFEAMRYALRCKDIRGVADVL